MKPQPNQHKACKSTPRPSFALAMESQPKQEIHDMVLGQDPRRRICFRVVPRLTSLKRLGRHKALELRTWKHFSTTHIIYGPIHKHIQKKAIQSSSSCLPRRRSSVPLQRTSLWVPKSEKVSEPLQPFSRNLLTTLQTGELVFGVARIFASFNDTFVHVTDLRFVPTT